MPISAKAIIGNEVKGYTGSQGTGFTGSQGAGYTGSQGEVGFSGSFGSIGYTGSRGDTGYTGSQGEVGYTGSFGITGYTGSQGDIGYTGSRGEVGYTGSFGITGYTGSQGDVGYTGSQGDTGFTGSRGDVGYTGSLGDTGYTGSRGNTGYTGSQGEVGFTGSFGDTGYTGSQGEVGFTGSFGITGYTGSQGEIGFTGSRGDVGYTGSRGDTGYTGSFGNTGYTGSQGEVGFTGSQGDTGYTGSQGDVGYTGSQGDTGYTGSQGEIGFTGSFGDTGYTGSYGDTGFTGSRGDTGYTGSRGEVGFTGSQGDTGYTGSSGEIGFTGSQGDTGYTGSFGDTGYTGSLGDIGYTGSRGDTGYTGSKGDTGLGFNIAKTYANVAALTADTSPTGIVAGEFALINTGNVEDAENSKLYLWNGSVYTYVNDLSGAAGIMGPVGSVGYTGSRGDAGYTGSQGDTGYTGSQGEVGFTGSFGTTGYTGSQGDIGYTGSRGDVGFTGSQGEVGFTGSFGDTGYTGSYGDTGYTGSSGEIGFTGSQGDTGYTGSQGEVGFTGSFGNTGYTGSQGEVGFTGSRGDTGYVGSQGDIGYTGSQGDTGYTGSQGDTGFVGSAGAGYTGSKGETGLGGPTGDTGFVGSRGDTGYTGSFGDTGYTGSQGDTGFVGSRGDTGYTGSFGDTGFTGSRGDTGYTGSRGDTGYTGSQGDIGYTGSQGDTGYTGSRGDVGFTGSQGEVGFTGSRGDIGYTGSQGEVGFTGSRGDIGYTGSQGEVGFTGSRGDTGYTGSKGDIGPQGFSTSVFYFNANTTVTSGSPGSGNIIWDNGTQISSGNVTVSHLTADNTDIDIFLSLLVPTEQFLIQDQNDSGNYQIWTISGNLTNIYPNTANSYWIIPVTLSSSDGTGTSNFSNNHELFLSLIKGIQGNVGYTGSRGDTGYTGSLGSTGYTGSSGDTGYTGSRGDTGYTGSQGDTGYTGSRGDTGYTGSLGSTGYTGSQGDTGYTGSSVALTVSLIDPSSNVSNVVSNVSTIRFDSDAGFDVTDLGSGAVKVGMNSTFKYWEIDGQDTLVATGLDTVELIAGNNIVLTTNINASPKSLTIGTNSVLSNIANISAISYANLNITTVSQTAGYNPGEYYDWPVTWTFTQYGELKLPEITSTAAPYSNPYISTLNNKSTGFLIRDNSSPANEYLYKFGTDGITLPNTKGAYGNNNYGELKFDGGLRINTNFSACGSPVFNFTTSGEFVLGGSDRPAFRADPDSPTNLQVRLWNATNSAYSSLTVTNGGAILLGDLDSPYILTANTYVYNSPTWKPLGIQTNAADAEFTFTTSGEFVAPRIATNGNLDSRGNLRVTTYNFGTSQYDPVFYVEKDTGAIWSQNNLTIEGSANIADYLEVNWGIDSTSTTSGTFRVAGGVGITGNAHIGGNIYAGGLFYSNGSPFVGQVGFTGSAGAGGGGGGGGSVNWSVKTANYTAATGDRIIADTSGGAFTITLPASPSAGNYVQITDGGNFSANNLTVARNSSTIAGLSDDVLLDIGNTTYEFAYNGSTWKVTSTFGPKGFTGSSGTGYTGSASALTNWSVKTANYTAASGDRIVANTYSSSFYITLPATPSAGDYVKITDGYNFAANVLYVVPNGSTIENQSDTVSIDAGAVDLEFFYSGTTWQIVSTFGPTGFTGSAADTANLVTLTGSQTVTNKTLTGPILSSNSVIQDSSTLNSYEIGYRTLPQNSQSSGYTLVNADSGKHIYYTGSGDTITVPADGLTSGGNFSVGAAISIINHGAGNLTVTHSGSLFFAGNTTSSSRVIGPKGMASVLKVAANVWYISGGGIT